MRLDQDGVTEILMSGDFARLIGLVEDENLECKGQQYDLRQDGTKRELAKDISAFANADGGLIIIGVRTKKSFTHFGDEIDEIRPLDQSLLDPDQYYKILSEWLFPVPNDVKIIFYRAISSHKGVFALSVPRQAESRKPFLIK